MGAVVQAVKHSVMRTVSVLCVLLVIAGIAWAVYAGIIRPITKPNASTSQKAEAITNNYINPSTAEIVEAIKKNKEDAFALKVWPPKIKIGGFKITIWGD
jgi:flagellar biosynthesis/type III secretory pathway M-ring protein FliF/YscJ